MLDINELIQRSNSIEKANETKEEEIIALRKRVKIITKEKDKPTRNLKEMIK